jgi:non-heme chloroperoxidase
VQPVVQWGMRRFLLASLAAYVGVRLSARALEQWLASKPARYPSAQLRQEPQGEVHFIECPDGARLRAVTAGSGPKVMLAHGYGASLLEWSIVWELLLRAGYSVICFDQRGHEQSTIGRAGVSTRVMAEDYLSVLRHFDVQNGILVGHSMGGFVAIAALLEQPEVAARLSGLVLCATFAGRIYEGAPQNRLQLPLIEHGILQRLMTQRALALLFGLSLYGAHPVLEEIEVFLETFGRQDHSKLLPILRSFNAEDRYGELAQLKLPTVVLGGRQDRTAAPLHAERLAAKIPSAKLLWVEEAGHVINWEAPSAIVSAVSELATLLHHRTAN